ncbi:oligosaccharide flippase family protein [Shewanella psychropiezotolerans]|uniref:Oligosaccharide flippase family protein n=1 Tax=Shewanella psychropiezotolerans TaxID=2593655 RepID=A0ABX5WWN6_9GAMM|nr:oligosaccharide flippase family protein [Shewanella psychropiezotolerans]QDO83504.1 oligosaccharide flippase family protein [Shewanella psychropiezotolerans]
MSIINKNKDVVILAGGKILQVLLALISIKLLTSLLSEEEVGQYYLLLTILTLFNFAFLNPVGQYFGRHVIGWQTDNKLSVATNTLLSVRLLAILVSISVSYFIYSILGYDQYYTLGEFLTFVSISLLSGTYLVLLNNLNTLGMRLLFIKYLISSLFLGLILSLIITQYVTATGIGWLYGIALSQCVFIYPVYVKFVKVGERTKLAGKLNRSSCKKIIAFVIPITITLFLQWGQNSSYRIIIENKYSIETLAYVAVGFSVSSAIFTAVSSLATQYFNPIYFRNITNASKEQRTAAWNELAGVIFPVYICLALFVICLSPYLINVLVSDRFHDAYIYVAIGAIIELLRVSSNIVYLVSQSEVKTTTTIFPYIIGFVCSVTVLYFVDFSQYIWMIAVVLSVSYSIIFILLFVNMRRLLPISIKMKGVCKSVFLSIPFFLVPLIECKPSIISSLLIIVFFGMYLILCIYKLIRMHDGVIIK